MILETADILAEFPGAVELAAGGQKVVYAVDDPRHGPCVLKIGKGNSRSALERVRREVEVLQSLESEFFPKAYLLEQLPDGRFFILEERISGQPLSERIGDFADPASASALMAQVITGLRLLWDRRIVHRDVKPDNLIVSSGGQIRIIDLGIARLLDEISVTHDFAPMGPCTPIYASPEQLANRKGEINYRCDQFAIGIVYAQLLLEGRHPFDPTVTGSGDSVLANILANNWARDDVRARAGDRALKLVEKLLGREPFLRFRDTIALEQAFRELS